MKDYEFPQNKREGTVCQTRTDVCLLKSVLPSATQFFVLLDIFMFLFTEFIGVTLVNKLI